MKPNRNILAALLILGMLASCSTAENQPAQATDTESVTSEAVTTAAADEVTPDIPEGVRYDGYEFNIMTSDEEGTIRASFEIAAEEENGDVMNDAVYRRNLALSEMLGVTVRHVQGAYADNGWVNDFKKVVQAGDDAYDIFVADQTTVLMNSAAFGLEVSALPYVDLSKPWWDKHIIENTALGGKTYGLAGALNLVDDGAAWTILFNKNFVSNHGIPVDDLYQLVRDGKWTLDVMQEYCIDVSADTNGDGIRDMYDEWGCVTSGNAVLAMLPSFGGNFSVLDKNGAPTITADTEQTITYLSRLHSFLNEGNTCITILDTNKDSNLQRSIFIEGRALFLQATISYIPIYLRGMQDDFGVLPYPKWDENQKNYITTAQEWGASMWLVPRSASDPERTSIILEAMSYLSTKTLIPAYYDKLLSEKTTRDEQSVEMLDIIFGSRTAYDLVIAYNWGDMRGLAVKLESSDNTFASEMAKNQKAIEAAAEKAYLAALEAAES